MRRLQGKFTAGVNVPNPSSCEVAEIVSLMYAKIQHNKRIYWSAKVGVNSKLPLAMVKDLVAYAVSQTYNCRNTAINWNVCPCVFHRSISEFQEGT
jgi:hypothetical protein